ncbi:MAG: diaminopropionate ammonia-lyase [Osedax symbiont Rs2]|nr:MAG: diaminopropionate ammonia-lyase [Osedax symbiont Rs2]
MLNIPGKLSHFKNPRANPALVYSDANKALLSLAKAAPVIASISQWPGYQETPLQRFSDLAKAINVGQVYYKDEGQRFGLKSFKALGGAYAVARQLQGLLATSGEAEPSIEQLLNGEFKEQLRDVVISCATDGNHGRSVAWGAQMFGCGCVIYIHRDVSDGRKQAMQAYGAEVIRIQGNYDESVKLADSEAKKLQRIIVSDTSYAGYMEIPKDVTLGYTAMLAEIVSQLQGEAPSHVFIQGGVGGVASAVCGYFWDLWGEHRPRLIVVEPEQANCLQLSAKAGKPVAVTGDLQTLMAGLACGEVSSLAWQILVDGVDDFMTLSEDSIAATMQLLAQGFGQDAKVEAGESAVPGLATAILSSQSSEYREKLGLTEQSRILVIGTEGATDPQLYQQLINS